MLKMFDKVYICPKCGKIGTVWNTKVEDFCDCGYPMSDLIDVQISKIDYYCKKNGAVRTYEEQQEYDEQLREQFYYDNPLYDKEACVKRRQHEIEIHNCGSEKKSNEVKCPICNSTNVHKISAINKVASVGLFGIFAAGHVSKTFKCDNCGAKF